MAIKGDNSGTQDKILRASTGTPYDSANFTQCCFVYFTAFSSNINSIMQAGDSAPASGGGLRFRNSVPAIELFYRDTLDGSVTVQHSFTASLNTWYFMYGAIDSSGNWRVGVDGSSTTGSGAAVKSGSPGTPGLFHNVTLTSNQQHRGYISDMRFYSRTLSQAELDIIYLSGGKDSIVDGLVTRIVGLDDTPGTTVVSVAPTDIGSGGVTWSQNGTTGTDFSYEPSPYSIRKRRR